MRTNAELRTLALDPMDADNDHVRTVDDPTWHRVGDLRAKYLTDAERCDLREMRTAMERDDNLRGCEAPNPYAASIAARIAAEDTPLSAFERTWKAQRFAELAREPELLAAERTLNGVSAPVMRTLSDEELSAYAPPDGWAIALKKEQQQ